MLQKAAAWEGEWPAEKDIAQISSRCTGAVQQEATPARIPSDALLQCVSCKKLANRLTRSGAGGTLSKEDLLG